MTGKTVLKLVKIQSLRLRDGLTCNMEDVIHEFRIFLRNCMLVGNVCPCTNIHFTTTVENFSDWLIIHGKYHGIT
jgi:hypothetical protein